MDTFYDVSEAIIFEECGMLEGCERYSYTCAVPCATDDGDFINLDFENAEEIRQEPSQESLEEVLIALVYSKAPLWDHRLPLLERTKPLKEKLWLEIFNEFGGKTKKNDDFDHAILAAIDKVSSSSPAQPECHPICLRISELLSKMPERERTVVELELFERAFQASEPYL